MCGISGIFQPGGLPASTLTARLGVMNRALHHRGPDAGGIWSDPHIAVGFSHRRLAGRLRCPGGKNGFDLQEAILFLSIMKSLPVAEGL